MFLEGQLIKICKMDEKKIELRKDILLATHEALIGNISYDVRMITIDWDFSFYHIKAYFDRETTEDDLEDFKSISSEVIAHFPDMKDCKEEVEYNKHPILEIEGLKEMVFLRKGEIPED